MKNTYTGTLMRPNLAEATIELYLSEGLKWESDPETDKKVRYTGVISWDIISGEDAEKVESETDGSCIDEYHEYLVLHFEDGTQSTFRNSHVTMFIW